MLRGVLISKIEVSRVEVGEVEVAEVGVAELEVAEVEVVEFTRSRTLSTHSGYTPVVRMLLFGQRIFACFR